MQFVLSTIMTLELNNYYFLKIIVMIIKNFIQHENLIRIFLFVNTYAVKFYLAKVNNFGN